MRLSLLYIRALVFVLYLISEELDQFLTKNRKKIKCKYTHMGQGAVK